MPFIPRPVKPPPRLSLVCKVPEETATLLKRYAKFMGTTREYVIVELVRVACRKDKEFQEWLATAHPESLLTARESLTDLRADRSRP
jgi:hypothetical protein